MTPIDFEKIAKELFAIRLGRGFTSYHNHKYLGLKSGHEHQIDFSMEGKLGGLEIKIIGECKQYASPVSIDKVMTFAYRIWDISAHKGVMVSSNGFQQGAFKIAKSAGMSLVLCRKKQLSFMLSRNSIENNNVFLDVNSGVEQDELEYAVLESDEYSRLVDKNSFFDAIL